MCSPDSIRGLTRSFIIVIAKPLTRLSGLWQSQPIQKEEIELYKSYDDLPLMLSVQEVADILGISKSSAYVLSKEKGFPTLKIGSRVVIPRDRFIEWINTNTK